MLTPALASRLDLRMPLLGAAAWLGAVGGTLATGRALVSVLVGCRPGGCRGGRGRPPTARWWWPWPHCSSWPSPRARSPRSGPTGSPTTQWRTSPPTAPRSRRSARSPPTRASSPVGPASFAGDQVVWRLTVRQVTGRGRTLDLVAPVLVLGDADDARVPLGATVRLHGRLLSADDRDLAGLLRPSGEAEVIEPPGPWWRAAGSGPAGTARLGGAPTRRPAGPGARAGRRRRRRGRPGPPGRVPGDRADPPPGGLRHQPDPGRRVSCWPWPAGAGSGGGGCTWWPRPGSSASC